MGLKLERQLFENISKPTLMVGSVKIVRNLMALSAISHLAVVIIWVAFVSTAVDKQPHVSKYVVTSSASTHFVYLKLPPPPLPPKQKPKIKKPDKQIEKPPEPVPLAPVEVPNEVKPEQPEKPKEENLSDNSKGTESDKDSGEKGGTTGGVPDGIPGGVVGQSPSSQGPVEIKGNANPPKRTKYVHPTYPSEALRTRVEGKVVIEAVIGKNGKIKSVKIIRSVPLLDQAALNAVKKWEYTPMIVDSEAREVLLTVTINFELK